MIQLAKLIRRAAPNITSDELDAFIHAEDNLLTCAPYEIEDVIQSVTAQESSDESDSEDCPDLLSWGKVAEAVDTMKALIHIRNFSNRYLSSRAYILITLTGL